MLISEETKKITKLKNTEEKPEASEFTNRTKIQNLRLVLDFNHYFVELTLKHIPSFTRWAWKNSPTRILLFMLFYK